MKKPILILLLTVTTIEFSLCQIKDFSNSRSELQPEQYDGKDFKLESYKSDNYIAGLLNEEVYIDDKECRVQKFKRGKKYSSDNVLSLDCNGSVEIESYKFDRIYFKKGINIISDWMTNSEFRHIHNSEEIYDLSGEFITIPKDEIVEIVSVSYCKIDSYKYGICVTTSKGFTFEYSPWVTSTEKSEKFELKGKDFTSFDLVCCTKLNTYSTSKFKKDISNSLPVKGMTIEELHLTGWSFYKWEDNYLGYERVYFLDEYGKNLIFIKNGEIFGFK